MAFQFHLNWWRFDVYADPGYTSADPENWLKENGYRNQVQRRYERNKPLSEALSCFQKAGIEAL